MEMITHYNGDAENLTDLSSPSGPSTSPDMNRHPNSSLSPQITRVFPPGDDVPSYYPMTLDSEDEPFDTKWDGTAAAVLNPHEPVVLPAYPSHSTNAEKTDHNLNPATSTLEPLRGIVPRNAQGKAKAKKLSISIPSVQAPAPAPSLITVSSRLNGLQAEASSDSTEAMEVDSNPFEMLLQAHTEAFRPKQHSSCSDDGYKIVMEPTQQQKEQAFLDAIIANLDPSALEPPKTPILPPDNHIPLSKRTGTPKPFKLPTPSKTPERGMRVFQLDGRPVMAYSSTDVELIKQRYRRKSIAVAAAALARTRRHRRYAGKLAATLARSRDRYRKKFARAAASAANVARYKTEQRRRTAREDPAISFARTLEALARYKTKKLLESILRQFDPDGVPMAVANESGLKRRRDEQDEDAEYAMETEDTNAEADEPPQKKVKLSGDSVRI